MAYEARVEGGMKSPSGKEGEYIVRTEEEATLQ